MGITIEQAEKAGKLAAKITALQGDIAEINAAMDGGATMLQIVVSTTLGVFRSDHVLEVNDTSIVLTTLRGIVQANIDALTAQMNEAVGG